MGRLSREIKRSEMAEAQKLVRSASALGLSIQLHAFGNWKTASGKRVDDDITVLEIRAKSILAKVGIGTQQLKRGNGSKLFITLEG